MGFISVLGASVLLRTHLISDGKGRFAMLPEEKRIFLQEISKYIKEKAVNTQDHMGFTRCAMRIVSKKSLWGDFGYGLTKILALTNAEGLPGFLRSEDDGRIRESLCFLTDFAKAVQYR